MGHADDATGDDARRANPTAEQATEPTLSRRSMLTVGVPAVFAVVAVGAVPIVLGARDRTTIGTAGIDAGTNTSPTTTSDLLTRRETTDTVLPGSTTTTTSATTTSTTTTSTTTLPPTTTTIDDPAIPIAPPDPRSFEELTPLGSMSIPTLGVEAPLLEGIRMITLDAGPGHWPGSAMPGQVGNVVVAAHRTSHGGPFRNIDQLVAGDIVEFTTEDGATEYEVTGTQIVNPDALWIVDPTPTPTATLFACHPPGSVAQRIVVNLELVV